MDYLKVYREMISLRGLTDHTIKSYSTYIRSYLDYLQTILGRQPEDVSWEELREYIRWLQKDRSLSDRTINHCISQLRFFTLYVLHKPWDPTQLPMRKFDSYLPFVPTQKEAELFISSLLDLKPKPWSPSCILPASGSARSAACVIVTSSGKICASMSHIPKTARTVMRSSLRKHWTSLRNTGLLITAQPAGFFQNRRILPARLIPFISCAICAHMKIPSAGNTGSPAILSGMRLVPISMKTALTPDDQNPYGT